MSRIKLGILGVAMLAAVIVSALGATTASAAFTLTETECKEGVPVFCYENEATKKLFAFKGVEEGTGTQESAEPHLLKGNLGESIRIECSAGTLTGNLTQEEPLVKAGTIVNTQLKFTGCKITETAALVKKCKITLEKLDTRVLKGQLEGATDPPDLHITPGEGTTIAAFLIENNGAEVCPATVKGEKLIKGLVLCELLEAEVDAKVKLVQCGTGSELTFGENAAEFDAEFELVLKNTIDPWSVGLA